MTTYPPPRSSLMSMAKTHSVRVPARLVLDAFAFDGALPQQVVQVEGEFAHFFQRLVGRPFGLFRDGVSSSSSALIDRPWKITSSIHLQASRVSSSPE